MKKITTLLLTAVLAFSLAACGGSKEKVSDDALNTLETAIQNIENIKSANYDMDLDMKSGSDTVNMGLAGSFDVDKKLLGMTIDMTAPTQGINEPTTLMGMYMDGEYMYMNMMEMSKIKQKIDDADAKDDKDDKDDDPLEAIKLPKDELKKYLTEASVSGDTLKLVFNCDKLNEEYKKSMADSEDDSAASVASTLTGLGTDMKFNSMSGSAKLEKGEFRNVDLTMNVTSKQDGKEVKMEMKLTLKLTNVNGQIKVELPKDVDTYLESDDASSALLGQ